MKKARKVLAVVLAFVLTATLSIAGTIAYLTDTDEATNVMTLGNVVIEQIEQERNEKGELGTFTQNKPALPAVGEPAWADEKITVGGVEHSVFADSFKNVVDKFVNVRNDGTVNAYVRTIIAIEAPDYDPNNLIGVNVNENSNGITMTGWTPVVINGVEYVYSVFTYNNILAPGAETPVSLAQVYLASETTNEDVAKFGDTWEILAFSQGVQSAGFGSATEALNTAFGEATAANVASWLA